MGVMMVREYLGDIKIGDDFFKRLTNSNEAYNSIHNVPRGNYQVTWNSETQTLELLKEQMISAKAGK